MDDSTVAFEPPTPHDSIESAALLEALPIGVYCCAADGRITRFNRKAAELWGRTPRIGDTDERFCGAHALFLPDGSPLPHDKTPMADVLRDHQPAKDLRVIVERPDGTRVTALVNIDPLFDAGGNFAGAINCFQDISQLAEAQEEFQRSKDDLDDFFENAAIGLHVVAQDGTILRANRAELDMLGYERSEYIGRHIADFHADEPVIADILNRLSSGEALDRYPARLRAKDGSIRHVLITSNGCFRDGIFLRTRCFTQDVTKTKLAEERIRESELRFRNVLESIPLAIFTTDADGIVTYFNRAAAALAGREPQVGVDRYSIFWRIRTTEGEPLAPDDIPLARALREKTAVDGIELIGERPDGSTVRYMPHPAPLFDAQGRLTGAVNLLEDITRRHEAEMESAHLAAIVASSSDAIVSKTLQGIVRSWNAGAEHVFGYTADEIVGRPITTIIPPELYSEEEEILSRLQRGEPIRTLETERIRKDGRRIDVSLTVSPVHDRTGRVIGASKVARDITDRKRVEQLQRLLIGELNHRVKNTLATVQSIANQTVRLASSPAEFATSFSGRIRALARMHDVLTHNSWQGADVGILLRDQLLLGEAEDERIVLSGPSLTLDPQPALHLALVLHELGTNARKYGSLSVPEGRLSVDWEVKSAAGSSLLLVWQESGGPPVEVPTRRGFGTSLIEKSLAAHGGEVSIHYRAEGVRCEIMLPIPDRAQPQGGGFMDPLKAMSPRARTEKEALPDLGGKRVLVVEDESLIAMDIASTLSEAGCIVVGPAATPEKAHQLIAEGGYDAALLDANLSGEQVGDLAAELTRRGVPFSFLTGYERDGLPEAFRHAPMIGKPFMRQDALAMIARLTATEGKVVPIRQKKS
ncbi:PAS domain S-box protein [Chelativorans sp. AA-79]|uniref:PAS domain S-box protein n=1 Tax=Chelativorans sp. AA-79 TaxID=3028735 RepID=UPI0023F811A8|nr:PAS domain S-box protein [Chelativorans sp. AA-79]WEX07683.1 PAS domain S-box protein [Chelativorans sp. AA-79]